MKKIIMQVHHVYIKKMIFFKNQQTQLFYKIINNKFNNLTKRKL